MSCLSQYVGNICAADLIILLVKNIYISTSILYCIARPHRKKCANIRTDKQVSRYVSHRDPSIAISIAS